MTHWNVTHPKARKPHFCDLCSRVIRPGETYSRGAGMDGSTAWTWRECAHCDAIRDVARRPYWDEEYGMETIAYWEPNKIHLLRLKAMWKRKWERADGSLYPVPEKVWKEDRYGFGAQVDARAAS